MIAPTRQVQINLYISRTRYGNSSEINVRKMKKLEIRVHQHAPIFAMARLSRGINFFVEMIRFWDIGDFWGVEPGPSTVLYTVLHAVQQKGSFPRT